MVPSSEQLVSMVVRIFCCHGCYYLIDYRFFVACVCFSRTFILGAIVRNVLFPSLLSYALSIVSYNGRYSRSRVASAIIRPARRGRKHAICCYGSYSCRCTSSLIPPGNRTLTARVRTPAYARRNCICGCYSYNCRFDSSFIPPAKRALSIRTIRPAYSSRNCGVTSYDIYNRRCACSVGSPLNRSLGVRHTRISIGGRITRSRCAYGHYSLSCINSCLFCRRVCGNTCISGAAPLTGNVSISGRRRSIGSNTCLPLS